MFLCKHLRTGAGLLFGGLISLALAAPSAARAADPAAIASPQELAHKLEAALKAAGDHDLTRLLADTPQNRGREELLAAVAEYHGEAVLEYTLQEGFGGVEKVTWQWKDAHIEVLVDPVDCGGTRLQLRVSVKEADGAVSTRDVPAYLDADGQALVLPEGFFGLDAEHSRVLTDLNLYLAKLYDRMTDELSHGKYSSREEVSRAIAEDLRQAEPMQRFSAKIVAPIGEVLGKVISAALQKVARP